MNQVQNISEPEYRLDNYDINTRLETLRRLKKACEGDTSPTPSNGFVNLHCHTFFSYNSEGYSPSHIVWKAFREGLEVLGTIDFDVLDNVEETLDAGEILGIRTTAGLETRVFVEEFNKQVINSPGEPGIYYLMGTGFCRKPDPDSDTGKTLGKLKTTAENRNLAILGKLNDYMQDITLDYNSEVLSLTPAGNATERHILKALDKKARATFSEPGSLSSFWAAKLKIKEPEAQQLIDDETGLQELMRSKLMKQGGIGYTPPKRESFPGLEEVIEMTLQSGGLPTATWLDGTSEGESETESLLEFFIAKGTVILNIIPDRNWNIKDPGVKKLKVKKLTEIILTARKLDLPVIAGTEMNKPGQRFVDDFDAPELKPYLEDFRRGAFLLYGHTQLARYSDKGFNSPWSDNSFKSRSMKNKFFTETGQLMNPVNLPGRIGKLNNDITPEGVKKAISV